LIPRKFLLGMVTLFVVLALAACGSSATPTPADPPPSVTMETTGGVAGVHKTLEVTPGKAKYTSGTTSKEQEVDTATYNTLVQGVNNADFFNLKDSYDNGGVADDIYYTITVKEGPQMKTVKVAQVGGKDVTPEPLQAVISQMTTIQAGIEE
jgi:hypothetical protein